MALSDLLTTAIRPEPGPKPRDDELDLFGVTHPGKVRAQNQDHFLVCTVHQQVVVHGTSLPEADTLPLRSQRLATLMLVADGVGGGWGGQEASQLAVETITGYVASTMRSFHSAGRQNEHEFFEALKAAAREAHDAVRGKSGNGSSGNSMATTLTLALFVWPRMYVLQVGDSRCYYYVDGQLRQVTRDQTVAQALVDRGVIPAAEAAESPYRNVLASSIGGGQSTPEVTQIELVRSGGPVAVLCSDGLTRHVSDDEIARTIRSMRSSEQACRSLLDLALERGGTDNITVLVARLRD